MTYIVTKVINGIAYLYQQRSYREGKKVRTECRCIGRVGGEEGGAKGGTRNAGSGSLRKAHTPHTQPTGGTAERTKPAEFNTTPKRDSRSLDARIRSARRTLEVMERTNSKAFADLKASYEKDHAATNKALYRFLSTAEDAKGNPHRMAWTWRIGARLFGYYNRHGKAKTLGISTFGKRRDWREECARELAELTSPEAVGRLEKEAKKHLRAARSALTKTKNRRTWGAYRRRTVGHAAAQVELNELRLKRLGILAGFAFG